MSAMPETTTDPLNTPIAAFRFIICIKESQYREVEFGTSNMHATCHLFSEPDALVVMWEKLATKRR